MSEEVEEVETRRHWSTKARLILAGVAVLGVGAAITTAAWTDDVFFEADAGAAGGVDLQGCINSTVTLPGCDGTGDVGWEDSTNGAPGAIDLAYDGFSPFLPDATQTFEIALRNQGTGTATLSKVPATPGFVINTTSVAPADDATCGDESAWAVTYTLPASLGPAAVSTPIAVTVTAPALWADACSEWAGSVILQVHGQATTP